MTDKLAVSRQTVSKWKLGETTPEMEKIIQISNYFGVSTDELLSGNEEKTNYNGEFIGVVEKYIPKNENEGYVKKDKKANKLMYLYIIIPVICFLGFIVFFISMAIDGFNFSKKMNDSLNNYGETKNTAESIMQQVENSSEQTKQLINETTNQAINGITKEEALEAVNEAKKIQEQVMNNPEQFQKRCYG